MTISKYTNYDERCEWPEIPGVWGGGGISFLSNLSSGIYKYWYIMGFFYWLMTLEYDIIKSVNTEWRSVSQALSFYVSCYLKFLDMNI